MGVARLDDDDLVARIRSGDERAFTTLHDRYRRPLTAYTGRILRGTGVDPDDVLQDVWINAHRDLRTREHAEMHVKPWLYRMARNRAIDELRRPGRHQDELEERHHGVDADPSEHLGRRDRMRQLLADVAELPDRQRHALLRREVDGASHADLARELDLGVTATKMLVFRAREGLIKAQEAREADCQEIRVELAAAHDDGRRPTERALRHVKACEECATYRAQLKALKRRMRLFNPGLGLGAGPVAVLANLLGGGGGKAAVAAATVAVAVAGGVSILSEEDFKAGDPAPIRLVGEKPSVGRQVGAGQALPNGTTLNMKEIGFKADPIKRTRVAFTCPPGMITAGIQPTEGGPRIPMRLADDTPYGGRSVDVEFGPVTLKAPAVVRMGILCKRP